MAKRAGRRTVAQPCLCRIFLLILILGCARRVPRHMRTLCSLLLPRRRWADKRGWRKSGWQGHRATDMGWVSRVLRVYHMSVRPGRTLRHTYKYNLVQTLDSWFYRHLGLGFTFEGPSHANNIKHRQRTRSGMRHSLAICVCHQRIDWHDTVSRLRNPDRQTCPSTEVNNIVAHDMHVDIN